MDRKYRFFLSLGFGLLSLAGTALAGAPAVGGSALPKAALPEIRKIELQPSSLGLANASDARQVLVWGIAADGQKYDLTDIATLEPGSGVKIVDGRYIAPVAAGDTQVKVSAAGQSIALPVKVAGIDTPDIRFGKDVMPVLASTGCNMGTCHGSAQGKNGFKLSLRGYDADYDYNVLVNALQGRRVNRVEPDKSLMLMKPAGIVPHEGKQVIKPGDRHYNIIRDWIAQGLKPETELKTAKPTKIEVVPAMVALDIAGRTQRIVVVAHYADGSTRDVTRDAVFSASNIEAVQVDGAKVTGLRRGEAAVLVRYEGAYAAVGVSIMGDRAGFAFKPTAEYNFIDKHVNAKLEKRKILPSEECTDADYLRRVYLDLTGLPPTADVARAFLTSQSPSQEKRRQLVDQLLGSKDYVAIWSNKWADLLQCNQKALGEKGVWAFREWIRESIAQNKPYDQFAYELITAQGSNLTNPAVNYYRALKDLDDKKQLTPNKMTEDISQTFLGVRFNCNKCHDHPFEKWTQQQYYEFGAFFARVSFKPGTRAGEEIVYTNFRGGENIYPKTTMALAPHVPYGEQPNLEDARVRQEAFARWMTSKDNPLFARSYVNRTWSYFFGVGIIDPVDDIRASNPPSNPELLDALTDEFVKSGFNMQQLVRTIVTSRTYQASVVANHWNNDDKINFSHFLPRRLSAEQMMDAVGLAAGVKPKVQGLPDGMRAVYLADGLTDTGSDFLKLFGRPKRETACECERTSNMSLAHALNLVNGPLISGAVTDPASSIGKLVEKEKDNRKVVEEIYLGTLSRMPTAEEMKLADELGTDPKQRLDVAQDVAWALMNSPAFLFNR
ncbi:DUF1549 and DUF1553 domain-containing protein [Humisphaera borealis]|uniref:DUF1549 domain-containing protein n=1 Tax=Humisphaera borealis TaxID=2807512 RepID=A0A7M2X2Y8_9BACT|nr:DUF1549 and DUF1553 domain-containing protein [Humisphaera borealis]QOV92136.1 DUF1549 domain-containing protein [Humisphaera borealis]